MQDSKRNTPGDSTASRIQVRVGHWTDATARTGCTVVLFDRPAPAVVDVRGGAPGTRETDLLAPGRLVRQADAILLTGGSAFGLAAAEGVMDYLRRIGRGVTTPAGPVPIVPAAVIFDLSVGRPIAPGRDAGYAACEAAVPLQDVPRGLVGAGTGATCGKLYGASWTTRGGFGIATVPTPAGQVSALAVVNPAGTVMKAPQPDALTGPPYPSDPRLSLIQQTPETGFRESTTLCVVLVDAPVDEVALIRCAVAAHDGIARAIWPSHTLVDGDVVFACALATGAPTAQEIITLAVAAEIAVERAINDAVAA
jgi:L-aminopeptidase/D-esterase-like protein